MSAAPRILPTQVGFTLVELLIVISIIAIITGSIIPSFNDYIDNQNTKQAQEQIEDDLRTIQNKALNGELSDVLLGASSNTKVNYWGIEFTDNSSSYVSFVSVTTDCLDPDTRQDDKTYSILGGENVLHTSGCLFIDFSSGDITSNLDTSNIIVGPTTGTNNCRQIQINSSGLIHGLGESFNTCT